MKNINQKPLTLLEISEAAKKRVALITEEFRKGFEFIENYPRSVTFFGSARTKETDEYYQKAYSLSQRIAKELHYAVLSGGGPGIMEAANRGAYDAGGNSVGLTIQLPHEQISNPYITDEISFHYFFSRKVCLSFSAEAYVFFPGGFGTLDEFSEILTLVQTGKIPRAPMILVGRAYWKNLEHFFRESMIPHHMIDEEDLKLFTITDDEDEMIEIIKNAPVRFGLDYQESSEKPIQKFDHMTGTVGPISELTEKHCEPCEGGTEPLTHEKSEELLKQVSQWMLIEDKEIEKTYEFKDFNEAMNFVNAVARIAESEGHHPDMKVHEYKKVTVKISTHAIHGLSENDFILASKIDEVVRDKKF